MSGSSAGDAPNGFGILRNEAGHDLAQLGCDDDGNELLHVNREDGNLGTLLKSGASGSNSRGGFLKALTADGKGLYASRIGRDGRARDHARSRQRFARAPPAFRESPKSAPRGAPPARVNRLNTQMDSLQ